MAWAWSGCQIRWLDALVAVRLAIARGAGVGVTAFLLKIPPASSPWLTARPTSRGREREPVLANAEAENIDMRYVALSRFAGAVLR
jgi:hypothetical protein